jgi:hypothetical protein
MLSILRNRKMATVLAAGLCLALVSAAVAVSSACIVEKKRCTNTTTFSVHQASPPDYPCFQGYTVWDITSSSVCQSGSAGPVTAVRCGLEDTPIVFTGAGFTHTIRPADGRKWEHVANDCDYLVYSID